MTQQQLATFTVAFLRETRLQWAVTLLLTWDEES